MRAFQLISVNLNRLTLIIMPPKKAAAEAAPVITDTSRFAYIDCNQFEENLKVLVNTNCSFNILYHFTRLQCLKIVNEKINKLKGKGITSGPELDTLLLQKENLSNPSSTHVDLLDEANNSMAKDSKTNEQQAHEVLKARGVYKLVVNEPNM